MTSLWNLASPLRTGFLNLKSSGCELFGTVTKAGVNNKTVTVSVDRFFYRPKLKKVFSHRKRFQVHDEDNFCMIGDKVVIRTCRPMSATKRYFVKQVVLAVPRLEESTVLQFLPENSEPKESS
jgi:small subunit ribosomal protein S17